MDRSIEREWEVVQRVVAESIAAAPEAWAAFAQCRAVAVYTDGSAPVRNPGGQAGFAAVVVGFAEPVDALSARRPAPHAHLSLGGYVPARADDPQTSNNRAELAGVLAAWLALKHLAERGAATDAGQVTIWSDSQYVVQCGNGAWARKKNADLWLAYDRLVDDLKRSWGRVPPLQWTKGHAGNRYNEAADELASRAAFNFDEAVLARYRAAQAAAGREMLSPAALQRYGVTAPSAAGAVAAAAASTVASSAVPADVPNVTAAPPVDVAAAVSAATKQAQDQALGDVSPWLARADCAVMLASRMEGSTQAAAGSGPSSGRYLVLWEGGAARRYAAVTHVGQRLPDEAEYLTLIAALSDLLGLLSRSGHEPGDCTVAAHSRRELVVKQLNGEYKVRSVGLRPLFVQVQELVGHFKGMTLLWERGTALEQLLDRAARAARV